MVAGSDQPCCLCKTAQHRGNPGLCLPDADSSLRLSHGRPYRSRRPRLRLDSLPERDASPGRSFRCTGGRAYAPRFHDPSLGDGRAARRPHREYGRHPGRKLATLRFRRASRRRPRRRRLGRRSVCWRNPRRSVGRPRGERHEERHRSVRFSNLPHQTERRHALAAHHRRRGRLFDLRHPADHRLAERARDTTRHDPDRRPRSHGLAIR